MRIFLVRHAKAFKRSKWTEKDELRPLTERGERQASGIQAMLRDVPIRRVCSSPALRCRQTVDRLAADHSLSVEVDARLGADSDGPLELEAALGLLNEKGREPIVICASRSLIEDLLGALGVGRDQARSLRCQKGSVWVLDRRADRVVRAEYLAPREGSRGTRRAVLDIGSTSMSLLVADVGPQEDRIQRVARSRAELRLGATAKQISAADRARVVDLARTMQLEAKEAGSADLVSVATASLRNARNGPEIAERLCEVLESPLRVLTGPEEAKIVYEAARRRLDLGDHPTVVVDLGGGSLDLALGHGRKIMHAGSEPLGVTRLHSEYVLDDPMTRSQMKAIRERVGLRLAPHLEKLTGRKALRCAVAGGSVRALARLVQIERGENASSSVRGMRVLRSELDSIADRLRRATHAERVVMPGVPTQRADLLPTAAIVLAELLDQLELPKLRVCDWGLREGVLISDSLSSEMNRRAGH